MPQLARDPGLAELVAEIKALRDRVAALERAKPTPTGADRALLHTIAAVIGDAVVFSAADLFDFARHDPALRQALRGVHTPKRLGQWLRRLAGRSLDGCRLQRIDRREEGCIWCVAIQPDAGRSPERDA